MSVRKKMPIKDRTRWTQFKRHKSKCKLGSIQSELNYPPLTSPPQEKNTFKKSTIPDQKWSSTDSLSFPPLEVSIHSEFTSKKVDPSYRSSGRGLQFHGDNL